MAQCSQVGHVAVTRAWIETVSVWLPLSAKLKIALEAGKVLHMPGASLRLGALIREDDLGNGEELLVERVRRINRSFGPYLVAG